MAENGFASGPEAIGAMGALRTGNVVVDMMIAMLIPLVFKLIYDWAAVLGSLFKQGEFKISYLWSGPMCEREIDHKTVLDMWGDTNTIDRDTRNNVLMKAIQLYLDQKGTAMKRSRVMLTSMTETDRPCWWQDDDNDEKTPAGKLKKYRLLQKAPSHRWQSIGVFGAKADKGDSKSFGDKVTTGPAMVEMRVEESEEDKGEKAQKTISTLKYRFRSRSAQAIDSFISEAYQWYLGELAKLEDNSRYLYEMQLGTAGKNGGDDGGRRVYKRYRLSDEKTFSSLFFSDKPVLLNLFKHFLAKTGKYSIAGYPHKLGLLLHGPPGTGKTSLIKAMAQHTGRSIVNVPLARISTNQELMDIMFDQQYAVLGEEVPIKLGFKDVIFVMEDVDAASKIVHRRDGKMTAEVTCTDTVEASLKTPWELLLETNDEEVVALVKLLMEKSARLKGVAIGGKGLCGMARLLKGPSGLSVLASADGDADSKDKKTTEAKEAVDAINEGRESVDKYVKQHALVLKRLLEAGAEVSTALEDELLGVAASEKKPPPPMLTRETSNSYGGPGSSDAACHVEEDDQSKMDPELMMATLASMMAPQGQGASAGDDAVGPSGGAGPMSLLAAPPQSNKDRLNLSGLLNVLDGVVDTPQRILVMTTNHPEMLDPALIRPGRIDKKILLSYMAPVHIQSMIQHYFQPCELNAEQSGRLHLAILGDDEKGFPSVNMTPAQVEQLCAEHDELEDMIQALEAKGRPYVKAVPAAASPKTARARPMYRTSSTTVRFDQ